MDMLSAVSGMVETTKPTESTDDQKALRQACNQVEGMFLKILLKEGMGEMVDKASGHSGSALSYALEKTAEEIARTGGIGVADTIYDQLSANL